MRIWLLAFLFFFSCAPVKFLTNSKGVKKKICEAPIFYVIDDEVPKKFHDEIQRGMAYWNVQLQKRIFYSGGWQKDPTSSSHILVIKTGDLDKKKCAVAILNSWSNGCHLSMDIVLNTTCLNRTEPEMETLIRHEAGHILGLDNSENSFHLMYKSVLSNVLHPTDACDEELEALREHYGKEQEHR